jgi:hypothetical protein
MLKFCSELYLYGATPGGMFSIGDVIVCGALISALVRIHNTVQNQSLLLTAYHWTCAVKLCKKRKPFLKKSHRFAFFK